MAYVTIADYSGNAKAIKVSGTATSADPAVPHRNIDVIAEGTNLIGKVSIDQVTEHANEVVSKTGSLVGLEGDLPDTTANDLATINSSTAAVAALISGGKLKVDASVSVESVDIGDVDILEFPAGNLGQRASAASLSVTPATDVADATYIGDIKFGEALPAGDANIGNVDIVTLPSGNLGAQAKSASLCVNPASDISDATYIGDIKFGESLPAGTSVIGKTGIDQTTDGTTNHVHVNGIGASAIEVENVALTVVDTEYNYTIPANCKSIEFWSRGGYPIRWEFTTGHVATPSGDYLTLKSNCSYSSPPALNLSSKTIYFASDNAGDVVEIVSWS